MLGELMRSARAVAEDLDGVCASCRDLFRKEEGESERSVRVYVPDCLFFNPWIWDVGSLDLGGERADRVART